MIKKRILELYSWKICLDFMILLLKDLFLFIFILFSILK
jgi:hypothetical protein